MGLHVVTKSRYLGGFIDDQSEEMAWIENKVLGWTASMELMDGVVRRHPHTSYAGIQKSIPQEWYFSQCVSPGVGEAFCPVEEALKILPSVPFPWSNQQQQ